MLIFALIGIARSNVKKGENTKNTANLYLSYYPKRGQNHYNMMLNIKKYFLTFFITSFVSVVPLFSGVAVQYMPERKLEAFVRLDERILKVAKQRCHGQKRKIVQAAVKARKAGDPISDEALEIINEMIGHFDASDFTSPIEICDYILQQLEFIQSVQYEENREVYHELLYKPMPHHSPPKNTHYLTIKLGGPKSTLQGEVDKLVKQSRKEGLELEYISLRELLAHRQKLPSGYIDYFITRLETFIQCEKAYNQYKRDKKNTKYETSEGQSLRKAYKHAYTEVKEAAKELNIPKEYFYLFKEREEIDIRIDPETGEKDLQISVDIRKQGNITTWGDRLIVAVQHAEQDDTDHEDDEARHDLYANEEFNVKNYSLQQQTKHNLAGYLKEMKDEVTGESIYYVYYQVYDKRSDEYSYYLYNGESTEPIFDEGEFFRETYSDTIAILIYDRIGVYPLKSIAPWLPEEMLIHLKSAGLGGIIVLGSWSYTTMPEGVTDWIKAWSESLTPPKQPEGPISNGGLPNFTDYMKNVCWFNAFFQTTMRCHPEILTNTKFDSVNDAGKELMDALTNAMNKGQGPNERLIHKLRNALYEASGGEVYHVENEEQQSAADILNWYYGNQQEDLTSMDPIRPWGTQRQKEFKGLVLSYNYKDNDEKTQIKQGFDQLIKTQEAKKRILAASQADLRHNGENHVITLGIPLDPGKKSVTMQELLSSYPTLVRPGEERFTSGTENDIVGAFAINKTASWNSAMESIRIYYLKKKKEKGDTEFEGALDRLPEMHEGHKLREIGTAKLVDLLDKEDVKYDADRMNPKRLTEILFQKEKDKKLKGEEKNIKALAQGMQLIYHGIQASGLQARLSTNDDTLFQNIHKGLTEAGFAIDSPDKVKEMLEMKESPIGVNEDFSMVTFRYEFGGPTPIKYNPQCKKLAIILQRIYIMNKEEVKAKKAEPKHKKASAKIEGIDEIVLPTDFSKPPGSTSTLKLTGMIFFSGITPDDGGHYTCLALDKTKNDLLEHKMLYFNDRATPKAMKLEELPLYDNKNACIVFYERV